ncbi:MAG: prepilin-type N-terminal cleavage/methylation domain-containing protein [Chthoniobacter sp.]
MPASPVVKSLRHAFTLVELMVSMSVLSLLVLMFGSMFNSASHAWLAGGGNAERRRNARTLTDYIGDELKGAMLPVQVVNLGSTGNLQFIINPPAGQVSSDYRYADCIFWQAPLATEATYGDIAEVGYFVKWDETDATEPRPMLCRFFVNPSSTDESGAIAPNPNFLIFDQSPTAWLSTSLLDLVAPATKKKGYLGILGENVVGFWVRSYGLDGQELPRDFDSRTGYTCQFQKFAAQPDGSFSKQTWTEKRYLPARVRISIAQVDSHYAALLPASAAKLRTLTTTASIHDAGDFLTAFRQQAVGSGPLSALLPGLRVYSTEVQLTNAQ